MSSIINKRVTREQIAQTFDTFDVFRRGELKANICIEVASVFFHFLDCSPTSLFSDLSTTTTPIIKRDDAVESIYSHICATATNAEAQNSYDIFTSEEQCGPLDSIETVGTRFGSNASYGSHPDGYKLDPLLLALAARVRGEKKTSKSAADAALFIQNSSQVLYPERTRYESLTREEWEDLYLASTLLAPSANKRMRRKLHETQGSKVEPSLPEPGQETAAT